MENKNTMLKKFSLKNKKLSPIKNRKSYGLLLWLLVLFGYFLFVFNWVIMNKLAGTVGGSGWMNTFFSSEPSTTVTQAVNYTLTAMRGVGAIAAGWLIVKVGHRYAVIIAMTLLAFALPTVFLPNYPLFIIGRMIMAIGGTVLIVYTQPIISRFFSPNKKTWLLRLNSFAFNIGAGLPLILWMFPSVSSVLLDNWQLVAGIVAGAPLILLIIYWLLAENIEIKKVANGAENTNNVQAEKLASATWSSVAKDKNTWKFCLYFGGWLTADVAVILIMPGNFAMLHNANFVGDPYQAWETLLPVVMSLAGIFPGIFLVGWISKTNYNRRWYIAILSFLTIVFVTGAYLCTAYTRSVVGSSILMFFASLLVWSLQAPVLNIPHEMKSNSPQRISIIVGFIWGIGYLIYTIANITMAVTFDSFHVTKDSSFSQLSAACWAQFGIYAVVSMLMPICAFLLPKTKKIPLHKIFKLGFKATEEDYENSQKPKEEGGVITIPETTPEFGDPIPNWNKQEYYQDNFKKEDQS